MKTVKWSFVYIANSGGSSSHLNCSSSLTIVKRSVNISLFLEWLWTDELGLLLVDRFFLCFFLYHFLFLALWLLKLDEFLLEEMDENLLVFRTFFLSLSNILFLNHFRDHLAPLVGLETLLISFYRSENLLSDWELRPRHAVNNERRQKGILGWRFMN